MGATDVPFNKTLHYSAAKEYMHAFNDMTRKNTGKGTCLFGREEGILFVVLLYMEECSSSFSGYKAGKSEIMTFFLS